MKNTSNILVAHIENGQSVAKPSQKSVSIYQIDAMNFSIVASESQTVIYKTESRFMVEPSSEACLKLARREATWMSRDIFNGSATVTEKGFTLA